MSPNISKPRDVSRGSSRIRCAPLYALQSIGVRLAKVVMVVVDVGRSAGAVGIGRRVEVADASVWGELPSLLQAAATSITAGATLLIHLPGCRSLILISIWEYSIGYRMCQYFAEI